ncbi:unnamed protein product [Leuciscus chuanchicus]
MHSTLLDPGTTAPSGVISARSRSLTPFAPVRGQEDRPGPHSSREDHQPRPRPGGQLILTAPGSGQRTKSRGGHEETEEYHLPRIPATHPHLKALSMCWCVGAGEVKP